MKLEDKAKRLYIAEKMAEDVKIYMLHYVLRYLKLEDFANEHILYLITTKDPHPFSHIIKTLDSNDEKHICIVPIIISDLLVEEYKEDEYFWIRYCLTILRKMTDETIKLYMNFTSVLIDIDKYLKFMENDMNLECIAHAIVRKYLHRDKNGTLGYPKEHEEYEYNLPDIDPYLPTLIDNVAEGLNRIILYEMFQDIAAFVTERYAIVSDTNNVYQYAYPASLSFESYIKNYSIDVSRSIREPMPSLSSLRGYENLYSSNSNDINRDHLCTITFDHNQLKRVVSFNNEYNVDGSALLCNIIELMISIMGSLNHMTKNLRGYNIVSDYTKTEEEKPMITIDICDKLLNEHQYITLRFYQSFTKDSTFDVAIVTHPTEKCCEQAFSGYDSENKQIINIESKEIISLFKKWFNVYKCMGILDAFRSFLHSELIKVWISSKEK